MFLLLPVLSINAQQTSLVQGLPQVYVTDLSIPQRQMNAGDIVKGTFTLFNNSQTNAPDVAYLVALVGDFKNNQPTTVFDTKDIGKSFLSAGEKKVFNFAYQLPASVAGNELGIRVQTMFAGLYMGWQDAKIAVLGSPTILKVTDAKLVIGGKEFIPETGPVVPKGGTVSYKVNFSNPTNETISFTPRVKIYNRLSTGELLQKFSGESVTITAKGTSQTIINLPTFDYKPLVYAVELKFFDVAGELRAPGVTGRYMILGDMATIQTVSIDKTSLAEGETANVAIFYQPPPFDQFSLTGDRPQVGEVDLTITLFNENNASIGTVSKKINLDLNETSTVLPVIAVAKAGTLGVTATISKNGVELSKYNAQSTPLTETGGSTTNTGNLNTIFMLIVIAVMILALGAGLLMIIKKNKNLPPNSNLPANQVSPSSPPPPTSPTSSGILNLLIVLLIGMTLAVSLVLTTKFVKAAGTFTGGTFISSSVGSGVDNDWRTPDVFVNNPYNGANLVSGGNFNLEVRQVYNFCGNAIGNNPVTWTVKIYDSSNNQVGPTYTYNSTGTGGSNIMDLTYSFPLVAPSAPGTYKIDMMVDDFLYNDHYWTRGYIDIVVTDPLPTPVLDNPTEGPGGGGGGTGCLDDIKLTWSASAGATKYEVYRDGVILAEVFSPTTTYTDSSATAGSHNYYIVAVAGSQRSTNSNTVSATKCSAGPTVSLTATPEPGIASNQVTFTATPSGGSCGSSSYRYSYVGDDGMNSSNSLRNYINHTYVNYGSYLITVTVTKTGCQTTTANKTFWVNPNSLSSMTCEPSPKNAMVNQQVTWTAVPNPAGTYTYNWSGDNGLSGNTNIVTKIYPAPGTYVATVNISGIGNSSCQSNVNVKLEGSIEEF